MASVGSINEAALARGDRMALPRVARICGEIINCCAHSAAASSGCCNAQARVGGERRKAASALATSCLASAEGEEGSNSAKQNGIALAARQRGITLSCCALRACVKAS